MLNCKKSNLYCRQLAWSAVCAVDSRSVAAEHLIQDYIFPWLPNSASTFHLVTSTRLSNNFERRLLRFDVQPALRVVVHQKLYPCCNMKTRSCDKRCRTGMEFKPIQDILLRRHQNSTQCVRDEAPNDRVHSILDQTLCLASFVNLHDRSAFMCVVNSMNRMLWPWSTTMKQGCT